MKTFDQRRKCVEQHMKKIGRSRRKAVIAVTSCILVVAVLALVLFIPYDTNPPSMERYRNDAYYDLIQKINYATYEPMKHQNRFESIMASFGGGVNGTGKGEMAIAGATMAGASNSANAPTTDAGEYVEVTDNQVQGVIESDIFKRSSSYIFYLRDFQLFVYSIAKEESVLVGSFAIQKTQLAVDSDDEYGQFRLFKCQEMYLSADCGTITVVAKSFHKSTGSCTELISLDVRDPANIVETNRVFVSGSYLSSRMVDGQILVMTRHRIDRDLVDYDDPATFVPQVGSEDKLVLVAPENIECPDVLSHLTYTVIATLNEKNLEVGDTAAVLSYSDQLYVSQDTVYVTRAFTFTSEKDFDGYSTQSTQTQITGIRYADGNLEFAGSVTLDGSVKNQYSMDQHEGILRVVTSTFQRNFKEYTDGDRAYVVANGNERNVDLYCIDLENWEIAASVIGFAPDGDTAESVRFDGDSAYVCTAMVVTLTDPVYFFDLSDLGNITWTDTGIIDGYSSSLIQLGEGYLLGIGYGESSQLKIEVYEEVNGKVVSVCAYQQDASFTEEYKSYYIDRENDIIGLPIRVMNNEIFVLLHFDGCSLNVLQLGECEGDLAKIRGTIIDGYLYVLSNQFTVQQVW